MSKTLTEIAGIVSKIEDDLYDKSDEMLALQRRISELEELVRLPLERFRGWERGDLIPDDADAWAARAEKALEQSDG